MLLIFGSTALKHWFPDLNRQPNDLDYMGAGVNSKGVEYHWNDAFHYIVKHNQDKTYVDPNFLYTIKVSHAAWDIHWDKTMHDIMFLKNHGCQLDFELYNLLIQDWNKIHSPKSFKIDGKPEEFFTTHISRTVPHDELHHIVKFYDEPLHNRIRRDPNNVKTDKALWDQLSHEDKIKCVLEETYVFALERYLQYPPKIAFAKALKNLITKSTKGYFNLFMIDNFAELVYSDKEKLIKHYKFIKGENNE